MKKYLYTLAIILMSLTVCSDAASDKVLIESNLTQLAQKTLDSIYGENNFVVRVQVSMTDPKYKVKYTQQSSIKKSSKKTAEKNVYLLPGVPALKNLAPEALKQLPYDSVTTMVNPKIKKIKVDILAKKGFPKNQIRKVKPILQEVLGLKQGRDKVNILYKTFYHNPSETDTQSITIVPGKEKIY